MSTVITHVPRRFLRQETSAISATTSLPDGTSLPVTTSTHMSQAKATSQRCGTAVTIKALPRRSLRAKMRQAPEPDMSERSRLHPVPTVVLDPQEEQEPQDVLTSTWEQKVSDEQSGVANIDSASYHTLSAQNTKQCESGRGLKKGYFESLVARVSDTTHKVGPASANDVFREVMGTPSKVPCRRYPKKKKIPLSRILLVIGITTLVTASIYTIITALSASYTMDYVIDGIIAQLCAVGLVVGAIGYAQRESPHLADHTIAFYRDPLAMNTAKGKTPDGTNTSEHIGTTHKANSPQRIDVSHHLDSAPPRGSWRCLNRLHSKAEPIEKAEHRAVGSPTALGAVSEGNILGEDTAQRPKLSPWYISDGSIHYRLEVPLVIGTQPKNPFTTDDIRQWSIDDSSGEIADTHLALWCHNGKIHVRQLVNPHTAKCSQALIHMKNKTIPLQEHTYTFSVDCVIRIGAYSFSVSIEEQRQLTTHAA
ncbi:MAG: hypothetical protein Q4P66_08135 [Actinomycetaceae bacterium]|nr:hypothetical protein [Actinomycetaceae bacterium]